MSMALTLDRQNAYRDRYRALNPGWRPATEVYESLIRAHLAPDMRVLDIGCGRGGVLEQLGEGVARPVGLDPDPVSLREHRIPGLPRAAALAAALPLRAACVDLALASWVFEHLADPGRVFAELQRVLRPDGRVIFLAPNAVSLVALLNRALRPLQRHLVPRLYGRSEADTFPVYYRANTRRQIRRWADAAGLRCEQLILVEDPTYLAFSPLLFRANVALARVTPPVHLIGVLAKASSS
jgi:SAM-dependent methyltransferase